MLAMDVVYKLSENIMTKVADAFDLFLDEDFMMNIFSDLQNKVDPFDDYPTYMFIEKSSNPIGGSGKEEDKI